MMDQNTIITLRREPGPLVRSLVALQLRLALGLLFLVAGVQKFQGMHTGAYPAAITKQFAHTPLRPELVSLFARVLPYAEVSLGMALIAGVLTTLTATLSGVLLLHLFFGKLILNDPNSYPLMLIYLLVNSAVLWLSPVTGNYFSVDGLIFGWFWTPREEGRWEQHESPPEVPAPAPTRSRRAEEPPRGMFIS